MSIDVNWSNPYAQRAGTWLKGNLHTHTAEGSHCGRNPMGAVLDAYAEAGFDFLSLSDHMTVSIAAREDLILIPGIEWNAASGGSHTGLYHAEAGALEPAAGIQDQEALLSAFGDTKAFVVLNHPNWQNAPHYRREQLESLELYDAIEIYNGVIERLPGEAIATDKWDFLLGQGRKVLGVASDDSHTPEDIGNGHICVRTQDTSPAGIINAIRLGNFYSSSGLVIDDISREGDVICVDAPEAQEIQVIGAEGRRLARVAASSVCFDVSELDTRYVRFRLHGQGAAMAWTQPFFLDKGEDV